MTLPFDSGWRALFTYLVILLKGVALLKSRSRPLYNSEMILSITHFVPMYAQIAYGVKCGFVRKHSSEDVKRPNHAWVDMDTGFS